jgi:hypothetical protein
MSPPFGGSLGWATQATAAAHECNFEFLSLGSGSGSPKILGDCWRRGPPLLVSGVEPSLDITTTPL